MEIRTATGISLSSQTWGEADILGTYYTREFGKQLFVFKGLRKSRRRSRAAVQPGATASLVFYRREGRDACIVKECEVLAYPSSVASELTKYFHLCFMLELVEASCVSHTADPVIYRLLSGGIEALAETRYPAHLSCFFLLRILKAHGLLSDTGTCKACGRAITGPFTVDVSDCRPVCGPCLAEVPEGPWNRGRRLPAAAASFMRQCLSRRFGEMVHAALGESEVRDILYNLTLFFERYLSRRLRSTDFILSDRFHEVPAYTPPERC